MVEHNLAVLVDAPGNDSLAINRDWSPEEGRHFVHSQFPSLVSILKTKMGNSTDEPLVALSTEGRNKLKAVTHSKALCGAMLVSRFGGDRAAFDKRVLYFGGYGSSLSNRACSLPFINFIVTGVPLRLSEIAALRAPRTATASARVPAIGEAGSSSGPRHREEPNGKFVAASNAVLFA